MTLQSPTIHPLEPARWWRTWPGFVAIAGAVLVAMLGGLATEIGPWYRALKQPAWQAPDWLFGPVWTLIYGLCAASAARAWLATGDLPAVRAQLLAAWVLNALLNVGWSVLFFKLQRPDWAFTESLALWLSVALLVWLSTRVSRSAGRMLWPYLAWVSFAMVLNRAVVALNGPFGAG